MRIFVAPAALAPASSSSRGDEHHYLARVRRARVGDAIELVDGAGRARTRDDRRGSATPRPSLRVGAVEAIVDRAAARARARAAHQGRPHGHLPREARRGRRRRDRRVARRARGREARRRRGATRGSRTTRRRAPGRRAPVRARARSRRSRAADSLAAALAALPAGARIVLDPAADRAALADRRPTSRSSAAPRAASRRPSSTRSPPPASSRSASARACCAPRPRRRSRSR